jgi:phospholipid/cholesterol/gamma-HCH transport system substrate-binding protein
MNWSKEVKVGLLGISAILLFIFGYRFLQGKNILKADRSFYAVYDNVEGLTKSAPVTINGLTVGNIDDIDFLDGSGRLLVKFHVDESFSFSSESTAAVYSTGLIGGKALAIVPNFESTAPNAKPGDTLPSKINEGMVGDMMEEFMPLKDKIEHLVVSTDSALANINKILNPDTREGIQKSVSSLSKTLDEIAVLSQRTNRFIGDNEKSLGVTIKNLESTSTNFAKISDTLSQIEIAGTIKELESAVGKFNNVLDDVASGEGSLGKLMTDDSLYVNLERATRQAEMLLQDLKLNPKRYVHFSVFGKKPDDYEKPESRSK